jgi:hypothetical protein
VKLSTPVCNKSARRRVVKAMEKPRIRLIQLIVLVFAPVVTSSTIVPIMLEAQQALDNDTSCSVTRPPTPRFVPSALHVAQPSPSEFYFGSEKLWVILPNRLLRGVAGTNGRRQVKFPWFAEDLAQEESRSPGLAISGRRLDAKAPPSTLMDPRLRGLRMTA